MFRKEVLNLPNCITLLRIGIIPALFFLLVSDRRIWSLAIAAVFILAALTDLLDGYLARRYGNVTTLGKFLDPVADKLLVSTALIIMIPIGRVPAWIVAIIVMRDVLVDGLRGVASLRGIVIPANPLGKRKTLCQLIAVSALLIHYPVLGINAHTVGIVLIYLALVLTVWSGYAYFADFYYLMNRQRAVETGEFSIDKEG
ncbi:MAG: CDP-diacylglycerol--glycerol-3-phosphate 3-phosphatidyltransferase [Deltaproteobacteria bacterium]|nr:CDP-diacylglycerol--glycerol-3-phosphate 3-phosphatidyltransferase [Deltaproteobacteria bacterium]